MTSPCNQLHTAQAVSCLKRTPNDTCQSAALTSNERIMERKKSDFVAFILLIEQVFIEATAAGDQHT